MPPNGPSCASTRSSASACSTSPALSRVAKRVRSSHERYDGTGYPDRLAGEEIPLGARIVAVCDAFHAMTSERPYSKGKAVGEALAELRRCAGSQFDPRMVEAFCAEFESSPRRELAWALPARELLAAAG